MKKSPVWLVPLFGVCLPAFAQTPPTPLLLPDSAPVYSGDLQISIDFPAKAQSVVLWNGNPLPTQLAYTQLTAVIPAGNLQTLGYNEVAVYDPTTGVTSPPAYFFTYVPLTANGIVFDPTRDLIYGSIPSTAPAYGNSIVAIRPETGDVVNSVFIGSEPDQVALSGDGHYLYVSLDGASGVRRLNLRTFQPDIQFPLDQGQTPGVPSGSPLLVADMKVVPGAPNSVVISREVVAQSFGYAGVAAYVDGVMLPKVASGLYDGGALAFGGSADVLWRLMTPPNGMQQLTLANDGVTNTNGTQSSPDVGTLSGYVLKFDGGRYYLDTGKVVDPDRKVVLGTFAASGPVRPELEPGAGLLCHQPVQLGSPAPELRPEYLRAAGLASGRRFDRPGIAAVGIERRGDAGRFFVSGRPIRLRKAVCFSNADGRCRAVHRRGIHRQRGQ